MEECSHNFFFYDPTENRCGCLSDRNKDCAYEMSDSQEFAGVEIYQVGSPPPLSIVSSVSHEGNVALRSLWEGSL